MLDFSKRAKSEKQSSLWYTTINGNYGSGKLIIWIWWCRGYSNGATRDKFLPPFPKTKTKTYCRRLWSPFKVSSPSVKWRNFRPHVISSSVMERNVHIAKQELRHLFPISPRQRKMARTGRKDGRLIFRWISTFVLKSNWSGFWCSTVKKTLLYSTHNVFGTHVLNLAAEEYWIQSNNAGYDGDS